MSELIQGHLESMIPETEEMKRTKLYKDDEIRIIMKKRKEFEFKINGPTKDLDDFLAYIRFEKVMIKDIKMRRQKYRVSEKKSQIEFKIFKRIKYLYEVAVQRFDNNFDLMLDFFKFCKDTNFNQSVYSIVENMLKKFSQNVQAWILAAAWHAKKDISEALNVIHKGLAIHKGNEKLYCEAIGLELSKFQSNDNTTTADENVLCKKIDTYLQTAYKNIPNYEFPLRVLEILENYSCTKELQNSIVKRLLDEFYGEETVWHTLAQREYRGHYYEVPAMLDLKVTNSGKFRIKRCVAQYEDGLEKISEARAPFLWNKYLDWLISVHEEKGVAFDSMLKTMLMDALKKASENCKPLPEKYYVVWARLMQSDEDVLEIINKGLSEIPDSMELWKLKLKMTVMKDDAVEFNNVFREANKCLKEKSLPLWIMTLRYHSLQSSNRVLESIYEQGIQQTKEVSNVLKSEYIQWLALSKSINQARLKYNELAVAQPHSKDLHLTMAQIEQAEMNVQLDKLENIYRLLCEQFGSEDSDVWITRTKFYLQHHRELKDKNDDFELNEILLKIYKDAETALGSDSFLFSDFKEKFTEVGHGYVIV